MKAFARVGLVVVGAVCGFAEVRAQEPGPAAPADGGVLQEAATPSSVAPVAEGPPPDGGSASPPSAAAPEPGQGQPAQEADGRHEASPPVAGPSPQRPAFTTTVMSSPQHKTWEARLGFGASGQGVLPFVGAVAGAVDLRYADSPQDGVGLALAADVEVPLGPSPTFTLGHVEAAVASERFRLTLYPAGTSRLRVGLDPLVGFGGAFHRAATWRPVGLRGDARFGALELWAGVQAAAVANDLVREQELVLSPLLSAAYRFHPGVRAELRAAWFDRGLHPTLALRSLYQRATALAASGRLELTGGAQVAPLFDAWRYREVPEFRDLVFEPIADDERSGARGELEVVWSRQTALAPLEADTVTRVNGLAAVARGTARWRGVRLQLTGSLETPSSLWLDSALNDTTGGFIQAADAFMVATRLDAGAERCVGRLCPQLFVRLEFPAAVRHDLTLLGGGGMVPSGASRWVVLGRRGTANVLPEGTDPWPVFSTTAALRWQPLANVHLRAELTYSRDPNRTRVEDDGIGIVAPRFDDADVFGVDLVLQVAL